MPSQSLARRFEAVVFDWDGTAVPDRGFDASAVREAVEAGCKLGLELAIVSGTHVQNIDGQLAARPRGPGELHLLLNRGSETFRVAAHGPELVARRDASERELAALDRAAELALGRLRGQGLKTRIVSQRLNRRKIDLIPEPRWADPPKAQIAQLLDAVEAHLRAHGLDGLRAAVQLGEAAALEAGLAHARVTSDAKHIEIGLTDKSDAARWYFAHLWQRGIYPQQVLIVGDELGPLGGLAGSDSKLLIDEATGASVVSVGVEPAGVPAGVIALGGGPPAFLALLRGQLELRHAGALPIVASDPRWTLRIEAVDHMRERAHESLLTIADGTLGTRGSLLVPTRGSRPAVFMSGVYRGHGQRSELQPAPHWNQLVAPESESAAQPADARAREATGATASTVRTLDLRAGLLAQQAPGDLSALAFSCLAQPGTAVLRAQGPRRMLERAPPLAAPSGVQLEGGANPTRMRIALADSTLEAAAVQAVSGARESAALERIAAYVLTSRQRDPASAMHRAQRAHALGSERLLIDQRRAWAQRWEQADVRIDGDEQLQLAVRLALYHLIGSSACHGQAAVGARGLSGSGYRGHVFWDSDVFVLPFLAATHPPAARAILEYRVHRLPAARAAARAVGYRGARFAWESAASGHDVTPRSTRNRAGQTVAVHTGQREEHIVADVAWAAGCYLDWSGDRAFRDGPGKRLLVETARYWASRIERDRDDSGRAHIRDVIGPDEYHDLVDDNAYTNVMARWNLRRAFDATSDREVDAVERRAWMELAEALVDGYDPRTQIYEQFAGFFALEPLVISQLAPTRPIAADLLLSPERVRDAQVVKQADVLMLHHLVPDELAPESLRANLEFYEPRTAHASSLSPGIHAALFARAGMLSEAEGALSLAARIDLDDVSDSTAAGVHIAAMGSVWQALAYGFLGARPDGETLRLDPCLPAAWELLELRLRFRGVGLRVRVTAEEIELRAERALRVSLAGADPVVVDASGWRCLGAHVA